MSALGWLVWWGKGRGGWGGGGVGGDIGESFGKVVAKEGLGKLDWV